MYCTMAEILHSEEKYPFTSHMVQVLNMILFTASELYDLRMQLKDLATSVSLTIVHIGLLGQYVRYISYHELYDLRMQLKDLATS